MAGKTKKDAASGDNKGVTPYVQKAALNFQPAPPGALEALAAQLNAGYGAPQEQNLEYLTKLYRTMELPAPTKYTPGTTPGTGGSGSGPGGIFGDLFGDGFWSGIFSNAEADTLAWYQMMGMTPPDMANIDWDAARENMAKVIGGR